MKMRRRHASLEYGRQIWTGWRGKVCSSTKRIASTHSAHPAEHPLSPVEGPTQLKVGSTNTLGDMLNPSCSWVVYSTPHALSPDALSPCTLSTRALSPHALSC